MGISKAALKIFLREAAQRPFSGRMLTLGRQDVHFSHDFLEQTARAFGVSLKPLAELELSHKPFMAAQGFISDRTLFRALGFDSCTSSDYSDFEGADVLLDLNRADTPEELRGVFDVVFDGGTLEHVFHLPHALAHVSRALRTGGRVIHVSPTSNQVDHGFYMFSPTLFWDFYRENCFEIETFQMIRRWPRHNRDPWELANYEPGALNRLSEGGLDDGIYMVLCIATKTADSTADRVPQQGNYVREWQRFRQGDRPRPSRRPQRGWLRRRLKALRIHRRALRRSVRDAIKYHLRRVRSLRRLGFDVDDVF